MALLFDASSSRSKGTLSYIRNTYGHKGVLTTTSTCFYNTGMLSFTWIASVKIAEFAIGKYYITPNLFQSNSLTLQQTHMSLPWRWICVACQTLLKFSLKMSTSKHKLIPYLRRLWRRYLHLQTQVK